MAENEVNAERKMCDACGDRVYKDESGVWRHHGSNLRESYSPKYHNAAPAAPPAPVSALATDNPLEYYRDKELAEARMLEARKWYTFEQWCAELNLIARLCGFKGELELVEQTGADCWIGAYKSGDTPAEALREDWSNGNE